MRKAVFLSPIVNPTFLYFSISEHSETFSRLGVREKISNMYSFPYNNEEISLEFEVKKYHVSGNSALQENES